MNYKEQKVLIIDDDHDFAQGVSDVLEIHGIKTDIAHTGAEAENIVANDYDIGAVLSDIKLENENGTDILKSLKKIRDDLPVIMITAYPDLESAVESVRHAYEYLRKPCDPDVMVETVESALRMMHGKVVSKGKRQRVLDQIKEIRAM